MLTKLNESHDADLWQAGGHVTICTGQDSGIFLKYCGGGKINYKNTIGITKSVNYKETNVYVYNL